MARPQLSIFNRQRTRPFDLALVRRIAEAAREACLAAALSDAAPLRSLEEIEISIVSDRDIARVHGEFFQDPTPTDVITFHHGELLLGAGVITENGLAYGHTPSDEAALCVIHGMLHLGGWDDQTMTEARQMAARQEQIFKTAREMLGLPNS